LPSAKSASVSQNSDAAGFSRVHGFGPSASELDNFSKPSETNFSAGNGALSVTVTVTPPTSASAFKRKCLMSATFSWLERNVECLRDTPAGLFGKG
jgi:hypothetical protein